MVAVFVALIRAGRKTLEDVPEAIRPAVAEALGNG